MNKIKSYFLLLASTTLTAALLSCQQHTASNTEHDSTTEEEHASNGIVVLNDRQMKAAGIRIGAIEKRNLNEVVKANGQLDVPPQNRAAVTPVISGVITGIRVLEGQSVSKGQELAFLENPDLIRLQQEYLALRNGFTYVNQEYLRQQELKEEGAGTGKIWQQAEAAWRTEKAKLLGMEKQLSQLGISPASVAKGNITRTVPVRAPISGTVGHIAVNTGSYTGGGTPLMEIIDNSRIHCDLTVFEKDLFKVKNGQAVRFTLTNQDNRPISGEIYGVNKSFEDDSKGIIVHAVIRDADKYRLIPGMYVTALIETGRRLTDAVPADAIVRSGGKDFIFLLMADEAIPAHRQSHTGNDHADHGQKYHLKKTEVVTGISELGYTQISTPEKLPENAQIVTKGAFYLLSQAEGGGGGHNH